LKVTPLVFEDTTIQDPPATRQHGRLRSVRVTGPTEDVVQGGGTQGLKRGRRAELEAAEGVRNWSKVGPVLVPVETIGGRRCGVCHKIGHNVRT